jgi:hypothetical protein
MCAFSNYDEQLVTAFGAMRPSERVKVPFGHAWVFPKLSRTTLEIKIRDVTKGQLALCGDCSVGTCSFWSTGKIALEKEGFFSDVPLSNYGTPNVEAKLLATSFTDTPIIAHVETKNLLNETPAVKGMSQITALHQIAKERIRTASEVVVRFKDLTGLDRSEKVIRKRVKDYGVPLHPLVLKEWSL